ncbi:UNVERIFIED_ORG: hypothetical protein J2X74_005625 [Bacillus sp. 1751]|nr:hypothetical protein [Bacillus sp. 1751]
MNLYGFRNIDTKILLDRGEDRIGKNSLYQKSDINRLGEFSKSSGEAYRAFVSFLLINRQ